MDKTACKKRFYELVHPSLPNEWEVDQIIEEVAALSEERQNHLLDNIPAIWPISHSLGLSFLEDGSKVVDRVPAERIGTWVRTILRSYEQEGLKGARRYILQVGEYFLKPLEKQNVVSFIDIEKRMLFYLRGISGEDLFLEKAGLASTDTTTYFLPPEISLLANYDHNRFLYKFILSLHWGFHRWGTFRLQPGIKPSIGTQQGDEPQHAKEPLEDLRSYLAGFEHRQLAEDVFFLLECGRVVTQLSCELPGLTNQFQELRPEFVEAVQDSAQPAQNRLETALTKTGLFMLFGSDLSPERDTETGSVKTQTTSVESLYEHLSAIDEPYRRPALLDLLGKLDFDRTAAEIERRRIEMKKDFIMQIRALQSSVEKDHKASETNNPGNAAQSVLAVTEDATEEQRKTALTVLDNPDLDIPQELLDLIEKINDDLGFIPTSYFSAASGAAGHGFNLESPAGTDGDQDGVRPGDVLFDEWDFRRHGYRKNWCTIRERQLPEVHSTFVAATLDKHRGVLMKLRRQFEMMKTSEHFIRRQRDGDDLDLDAIVEARGDQRAGISPSGKWFVRLQRNERDIVTVFLIDMSNSTEGWVGGLIKEALVLLCEVMDVAGDPYEILGFSGMRRSRCDLYQVKNIAEPYSNLIRSRINAIVPREYTRMGPAIRYAAERLKNHEARIRLLVTITDGKPEDYDDYKGEYAVEDCRKALQEARGSGIHSFGITVDREAHEYLPHMFGAGNYIFINDMEKLPMRMVDMYRLLTI